MSYLSRIDHAFSDAPVLPLSENGRYVLFSDCHRGIGTSNDNFLKNQHLYFAALNYYYQHSFCYIELGDKKSAWCPCVRYSSCPVTQSFKRRPS